MTPAGLVDSAQVETTLLALKFAFLVLLYLFIWRIVRSAARDLRLPQESMILSPQQASQLLPQPAARELGRIVVLTSPTLQKGAAYAIDSSALSIGRGADNDLSIASDEYASSQHARFEPRRDGVYVEDAGSTNGTFVNGIRLARERRLAPGDVVRVGADRPEVRAMSRRAGAGNRAGDSRERRLAGAGVHLAEAAALPPERE